jgi:hypothetical protein
MFTTKGSELVTYQDKLYQVYRKIEKDRIKEGHINDVKEAWHCDVVIKKKDQETLLFLVEISDAVIVE